MEYKLTPVNKGPIRLRNNQGALALTINSAGVKVNEVFVKQCSGPIKALIEAKLLAMNKVIDGPTTVTASNPVITKRNIIPKNPNVFPGKASLKKGRERLVTK